MDMMRKRNEDSFLKAWISLHPANLQGKTSLLAHRTIHTFEQSLNEFDSKIPPSYQGSLSKGQLTTIELQLETSIYCLEKTFRKTFL